MAAVPACMEADLQAFLDYLDALSDQGPISQARLDAVLDKAEQYHTHFDLPDRPADPVRAQLSELSRRIETLREQREIDRNRNIEPGSDGIGPLLGGHF
jgi:hypothetical protein